MVDGEDPAALVVTCALEHSFTIVWISVCHGHGHGHG